MSDFQTKLGDGRLTFGKRVAEKIWDKRMALARIGAFLLDGESFDSIQTDRKRCRAAFQFRSTRSIWIHGEEPARFIAAEGLIRAIRALAPESRCVMTANPPRTAAWLSAKFPNDAILAAPRNRRKTVERFFKQTQPKLIILLESPASFSPEAFRLAVRTGVPVVLVDAGRRPGESPRRFATRLAGLPLAHLCVRDEESARLLREAEVAADRVTATGDLGFEAASLAPRIDGGYARRELGIPPGSRFILADRIHQTEEEALVDAFAWLRSRHRDLVLLWGAKTPGQRRRFSALLASRDLPTSPPGEGMPHGIFTPAAILLRRAGETTTLANLCAAVISGGTFTPLPALGGKAEPLTPHAPVLYGPFPPKATGAAQRLIEAGAAFQIASQELANTVDALLTDETLAAPILANARRLMREAEGATSRTVRALERLIPVLPDEQPARQMWRPRKNREALEKPNPAASVTGVRIETWPQFQHRLNPDARPLSILCLGNGPSSEDPQVIRTPHDCLFRANWRWKKRGILASPDAVFVGDALSIGELALPCVFIFQHSEQESSVLRSRRILGRKTPFEYFTLDHAPSSLWNLAKDGYARPSNGALMIATAVALRPARLTIAGYDLFSHPDGRYPGDFHSTNAYSQVHDLDYELSVIERALQWYEGELVILSPILNEALRLRKLQRPSVATG